MHSLVCCNFFQRNVSSAELVMVNRIFLADEKAALMKEKKTVLEGTADAKITRICNMAVNTTL